METPTQPKSHDDLRNSRMKNAYGQDVTLQDQHTRQVRLYLAQELDDGLELQADYSEGAESIQVSSDTAPEAGNFVMLKEGVHFDQTEVLSVTDDTGGLYTLELAMPLSVDFDAAATSVELQNCDMNVDASSTEVEFEISPHGLDESMAWDITRMIIAMYHGAAGDDGKFGGIAAISNGVYFHTENANSQNLFNFRENADLRTAGYDITYSSRSGSKGDYGTASRISFQGLDKTGVTIRLFNSHHISAHVRDDLSDLDLFRVQLQGHVVKGG